MSYCHKKEALSCMAIIKYPKRLLQLSNLSQNEFGIEFGNEVAIEFWAKMLTTEEKENWGIRFIRHNSRQWFTAS